MESPLRKSGVENTQVIEGIIKRGRSYGEILKELRIIQKALWPRGNLSFLAKYHNMILLHLGFKVYNSVQEPDEPDEPREGESNKNFFYGFFERQMIKVFIPKQMNFLRSWTYYRVFNNDNNMSLYFLNNENQMLEIEDVNGSYYFTTNYAIIINNGTVDVYYKNIEEPVFQMEAETERGTYTRCTASERENYLILILTIVPIEFNSELNSEIWDVQLVEGTWISTFRRNVNPRENLDTCVGSYGFYKNGMDGKLIISTYSDKIINDVSIFPSEFMFAVTTSQAYKNIDDIVITKGTHPFSGLIYDAQFDKILWSYNREIFIMDSFVIFDGKKILDLITGIPLVRSNWNMRITRKDNGQGYWIWPAEYPETVLNEEGE